MFFLRISVTISNYFIRIKFEFSGVICLTIHNLKVISEICKKSSKKFPKNRPETTLLKWGLRHRCFPEGFFAEFLKAHSQSSLKIKMMKNAFYFTSKAPSFSRHLNFCLDFLVMQQNGLICTIRLVSNFMTPQLAQQAIVIHILPNISKSKEDQTMKMDQLR